MNFRRIAAGLGANAVEKMVSAVAQLSMVPILSTNWGLPVYGVWLLLATIPSFLSMSDLGFASAAGTKMTMLTAQGRQQEANGVFQSAWLLVLTASAIIAVPVFTIIGIMPQSLLPEVADFTNTGAVLLILAVYGIISLQGSIIVAGFRAAGLYPLAVLLMAATIFIENAVLAAVVIMGGDPIHAAFSLLITRSCSIIVQFLIFSSKVSFLRFSLNHANGNEIRSLVKPALALMALPISQVTLLQGVAVALGAAAGPSAVPAFTATRTLSRIALQTTQMLTHSLMPEYSTAVAQQNRSHQSAMLAMTLAGALVTAVPFALVLAALGPSIVGIWTGGAIEPSHALTLFVSISVLCGGIWNPLSVLLLAMNRQADFSIVLLTLSLTVLVPAYWLSSIFGPSGAAAAAACLDVVMLFVILAQRQTLMLSLSSLGEGMGFLWQRISSLAYWSRPR
jgi:O-antigen/teichoic acid export membrane protein